METSKLNKNKKQIYLYTVRQTTQYHSQQPPMAMRDNTKSIEQEFLVPLQKQNRERERKKKGREGKFYKEILLHYLFILVFIFYI